jgi:beta-lactamase regulating signal transducer with metallopeptidase domain
VAELAFWFLPVSWLAAREYAQAREECCDSEAVRNGGAAADSYGRLLLEFGTGRPSAPVTAACVASPHLQHLLRRLRVLEQPAQATVRRGRR